MKTMVEVGRDGRVTLPAAVRNALSLTQGSFLELEVRDGILHLRPVVAIPREDAWAFTPEHQALLTRALADLAAGRLADGLTPDDLRRLAPADERLLAELATEDEPTG